MVCVLVSLTGRRRSIGCICAYVLMCFAQCCIAVVCLIYDILIDEACCVPSLPVQTHGFKIIMIQLEASPAKLLHSIRQIQLEQLAITSRQEGQASNSCHFGEKQSNNERLPVGCYVML